MKKCALLLLFWLPSQCLAAAPSVVDRLAAYTKARGPGLTLMVIKKGEIVRKESFGYADREKRIPITPKTNFVIGSLSKQMTAVAVLMMEKAGKVDPDKPITDYLPDLPNYAKTIKVRHLIDHQTGLPDYADLCVQSKTPVTNHEILEYLKAQNGLTFTPGTQYKYNNSNYVLLAELVQKVSGKNFAEFMREEIFKKLGMKHTDIFTLDGEKTIRKTLAHSYKSWPFLDSNDKNPCNYKQGPGSVVSNLEDYAKWLNVYRSEILLPKKWLDKAWNPIPFDNGDSGQYAYGWMIGNLAGQKTIWHDGIWLSFRTRAVYLPSADVWAVVFSNYEATPESDITGELLKPYVTASQ